MGSHWKQEDRNRRNLLNYGLAVCKMTLLIKDHKTWSVGDPPPSRSVMAGNKGGNTNISEYLSIMLEPVAADQESMEKNSTDGFLSDIVKLNEESSSHYEDEETNPSKHQEEPQK